MRIVRNIAALVIFAIGFAAEPRALDNQTYQDLQAACNPYISENGYCGGGGFYVNPESCNYGSVSFDGACEDYCNERPPDNPDCVWPHGYNWEFTSGEEGVCVCGDCSIEC